jgi:hypothetical protein
LILLTLMVLPCFLEGQATPGGVPGREPLCAKLVAPKQIGDEMVYPIGNGVSAPILVKRTRPVVPHEKASLRGMAVVCGIVAYDGRIHTANTYRMIGNGLDEIALDTVKQWEFRPAMKEGKPVAAQVDLQIKFGD